MKDGPFEKNGYDLVSPEWYDECRSFLNDKEKGEFDHIFGIFLWSSATREELLQVIRNQSVKVFFNILAIDAEEQAAKQQPMKIRNSGEYKDWRKAVFERDNYTCQHCGKIGGKLNAHHIKPFAQFPHLRLEVNNGITLCSECHKEAHGKEVK